MHKAQLTLQELLKKRCSPANSGRDCSIGFNSAVSYGACASTAPGDESPYTPVNYQKDLCKTAKKSSSKQTLADLFHLKSRRFNVFAGDDLELAPHMNRCYDPTEFQHIDNYQDRVFTDQADQDNKSLSRQSSSVI